MRSHSIKEMYNFFKEKNPKTDITYSLFQLYIEEFNKRVIEEILNGKTFYMGHNLGSIRIKKVKRNFSKPAINWFETNKLKKEGINQYVYYDDDYWYRWYWDKYKSVIKNRSVYSFNPMHGKNGSRKKLVKKLKEDEFAYLNFKE